MSISKANGDLTADAIYQVFTAYQALCQEVLSEH